MENKITLLLSIFFILLSMKTVSAIPNPSAVYCTGLGYEYKIVNGSVGICIINANLTVNAWDFFNGKIATEYGLCVKYNATETIENGIPVCIFSNGTKISKDELMIKDGNFTMREGYCGDGICQFYHENYKDCPQDCPSGSRDMLCDGMKDGVCDPDCVKYGEEEKDPDCIINKTYEKSVCNNNTICEPLRGENPQNCPLDCHCGNGICEREYEEESYCRIDCGNQVNQPSKMKFIIYGIIISLAILLIVYIIKSSKGETK